MTEANPYLTGLDKCAANYAPLTPISFIKRTASVYPDEVAVIDGHDHKTWLEVENRCRRMASALKKRGIGKDQTVSILAPNSLAIFESHFGVAMAGAVLNAINTRLDPATIAFILENGQAKIFLVDSEYAELASDALTLINWDIVLVEIGVPGIDLTLGATSYNNFLDEGDADDPIYWLEDEWDAISLNYTSGTTGNPKGVVYHHRGAYLNALSNVVGWEMSHHPVYLWTLPMFHCNGWCFPWTLAAVAGTSICLRQVNSSSIYNAIAAHGVTHFCGAPIIMNMVINANNKERKNFDHKVHMMTAAAPPPAAVLQAMEEQGFKVTHVYGLTETYGPAVICAWKNEWNRLDKEQQAAKKARQGVAYHVLDDLAVMDAKTMQPVARNSEELGETMFRGNIVMKGYLSNPSATADVFEGGWFHSGDLGVMSEDNYLQLKDRSKDIIISGGENISSIEVENCLYSHPDIVEAAVVAKQDDRWGETPCAFVTLGPGVKLTEHEVIDYCRKNIAHFKVPKHVLFCQLPKTSTGKVQKFKLRDIANQKQQ